MTGWLRIALAAQLLFFAGWGALLLASHRDATLVWLGTEPVDPRDLLSGHYVALRYAIADAAKGDACSVPVEERGRTPVWVRLAPSGESIETVAGFVSPSAAVACRLDFPGRGEGGPWITGRLDADGRVIYGIERMYVAEDDPRREARSGSVVAQVALNERFEPRLVDLVPRAPVPTATEAP
ncbi:MAG: GDYXXLXY domain-containing protein [Deltaproteobacteria bacterium]|nr:GDYXXLXY domain-containing protein [Deltaproteobacteria bacterium]